jgi:N-acetylglucosamine malate deacetylase 1
MSPVAFAVAAHPDDVEFLMAGTIILLGRAGYDLHYMTVANGSCGTTALGPDEIVAIRTEEAREAAGLLGATYHPPLVDDLQIYYTPELVAKLCAIVRDVRPEILLIPAAQDYMEDHMNTSRLMVTAAFCRGMRNVATDPPSEPVEGSVALYHAAPVGLSGPLREPMQADRYVDIGEVLSAKREALACHRSQKEWLDASQGVDSYLRAMEEMSAEMGRMSGRFEYAEAWRRHLHVGFAQEEFDPLTDALGDRAVVAD